MATELDYLVQIAQIDSDLSNVSSIDGELSPISQIDGNVGNVIPVDITHNYEGVILPEDWEWRNDGYYYYKVSHNTHNLIKPYITKFLVETEDGFDNAFYSYTVLANRDVRFRSHLQVKCEYIITGER